MYDFVTPNNNEENLAKKAQELKYNSLIFVYDFKEYKKNKEQILKKLNKLKINSKIGLFCTPSEIKKAQNLTKFIITKTNTRNVFQKTVYGITNIELIEKKDHTHYRRAGLNQVLAKLMNQKNITYLINFNTLLNSNLKKRAFLLGRIQQNIKLCKKYKTKIKVASFATNPKEMRPFKDLQNLTL